MQKAHYLWRAIYRCNDKEQLSGGAWKRLKKIAEAMYLTDFSGDKTQLSENLLHALGYQEWNELEDGCSLNDQLQFLMQCYSTAVKDYKGKVNRLFSHGDVIKFDGRHLSGDSLSVEFYRVAKRLKISNIKPTCGSISLRKLYDDYCNNDDADLVEIYMRHMTHGEIAERLNRKSRNKA